MALSSVKLENDDELYFLLQHFCLHKRSLQNANFVTYKEGLMWCVYIQKQQFTFVKNSEILMFIEFILNKSLTPVNDILTNVHLMGMIN